MSRIILALGHEKNGRLLARRLGEQHEILSPSQALEPHRPFDLCIVDPPGLARWYDALLSARTEEAPVFLPVLLVLHERTPSAARVGMSEIVDEFMPTPVHPGVLEARIRSLLRCRAQSRELRHRLVDAQRMEAVAVLAGGAVHDLNNLLTVIQHSASILLQEELDEEAPGASPDAESVAEGAERILEAVGRASELSRTILGLARRGRDGWSRVEPNEVVSRAIRIFDITGAEGVRIIEELDEDVPSVWGDPAALGQVVMNLIVNALDVVPPGGRISLGTRRVNHHDGFPTSDPSTPWAEITVSDTGPGMEPGVLAQIFDLGFTTKETGTGLGLASASRIVHELQGSIDVESTPGEGTTFRVRVPGISELPEVEDRSESVELEGPEQTLPVDEASSPTGVVLVVDDEKAVRDIAQRILVRDGHRVLLAVDADEAMRLLEWADPPVDVVLTDGVVPGLSRKEIGSLLSGSAGRDIRVAFMSGYDREELVDRFGTLGDAPFLAKPFSPADLSRTVRDLLRRTAA